VDGLGLVNSEFCSAWADDSSSRPVALVDDPLARIYIETTIASFYYEVRTEPEMVARRNWTRRWFEAARLGNDELVTSLAVEAELAA
jgi:hypothetical protein